MRRKALIRHLFSVYFPITLLSVLAVGSFALAALRGFHYSQTVRDLEATARLISQQIAATDLLARPQPEIQAAIRSLGRSGDLRITIVSSSGTVLADSERDPAGMRNHADRPEIKEAFSGKVGLSKHRSPTLGTTMVYVAIPTHGSRAALRVARQVVAIDAGPAMVYYQVVAAVLITALLAGIASLLLSRRINRPLMKLQAAASRFASGDFASRAPVPETTELATLAETLNSMAARLDQQVRTISRQAREQQAILSSMREGVIAVGNDDEILILNPTAEVMLGVTEEASRGKSIQEVFRNPSLLRLLQLTRSSATPVEDELTLKADRELRVQVTGTALVDTTGERIGALVVLNDVTQTRRLESIRRDFVANVSHELRTPITAIKGFVETLRDGADKDPAKSKEFLEIVARQADRLNAIIDDLLTLSSIEQQAEAAEIAVEPAAIDAILTAATATLKAKADAAGVALSVECDPELTAPVNTTLLEQALTNLLDNAVKYSPAGSKVMVVAEEREVELAIRVIDSGPGIEAQHLPRLFERFYRVDKARSRKLGGTGLGLAIVKHIAQAHRGRVEVHSTPGEGSTFTIFVPRRWSEDHPLPN